MILGKNENREDIALTDVLIGRMCHKILMIDLITNKEVELTLSKFSSVCCRSLETFDQPKIHNNQITREELCNLWPNNFVIINKQWALLLLKNNWTYLMNSLFVLLLVEIDYQAGKITPKDALILWDDSPRMVAVDIYSNLIGNTANAPLCSAIIKNARDQNALYNAQNICTLFISADFRNQKLCVLEKITGDVVSWSHSSFGNLVNRKMYQFGSGINEEFDGNGSSDLIHFHQMKIYDMDEPEKGLQLKQLILPIGYEQEFAPRFSAKPEMIHLGWSSDYVTLCLSARPPFYNVTNTFILNFSTLAWRRLQLPNHEAIPRPNLRLHYDMFYRFRWFSDQALVLTNTHISFDENSKRSVVRRWYRAHIRRPSSLLELSWLKTNKLNQQGKIADVILKDLEPTLLL